MFLSRKNENDTDKNENHVTGLVKVNVWGRGVCALETRLSIDIYHARVRRLLQKSSLSATEDALPQNLTQQTPKETHFAFFLVCRQNPGASLQVFLFRLFPKLLRD